MFTSGRSGHLDITIPGLIGLDFADVPDHV